MGMFDKDKAMAPDGYLSDFAPAPKLDEGIKYAKGTEFILWGAAIVDEEYVTPLGTTPMMHLAVSKVETPKDVNIVSSLGEVIAGKVRDKTEGDLPAVCTSATVKSKKEGTQDAFVIQFVKAYKGTEIAIEKVS